MDAKVINFVLVTEKQTSGHKKKLQAKSGEAVENDGDVPVSVQSVD